MIFFRRYFFSRVRLLINSSNISMIEVYSVDSIYSYCIYVIYCFCFIVNSILWEETDGEWSGCIWNSILSNTRKLISDSLRNSEKNILVMDQKLIQYPVHPLFSPGSLDPLRMLKSSSPGSPGWLYRRILVSQLLVPMHCQDYPGQFVLSRLPLIWVNMWLEFPGPYHSRV